MKKKFKMPDDFKTYRKGDEFYIHVKARNPIWIGFGIIIFLGGLALGWVFPLLALSSLLGVLIIFLQLRKKIVVHLNSEGFEIGKIKAEFENINPLRVTSGSRTISTKGASGSYRITKIVFAKRG
ncbi:MAG: hypothetical protein GY827_12300 [Cytophagales bacterium]|nr:hypothetical protein [Cytophagales bacterium]